MDIRTLALLTILLPAVSSLIVLRLPSGTRKALVIASSSLLIVINALIGLVWIDEGLSAIVITSDYLGWLSTPLLIIIIFLDLALMALFMALGGRIHSYWVISFAGLQIAAITIYEVWNGSIEAPEIPFVLDRTALAGVVVVLNKYRR